jgi:tungstate transport system ATP-binding protein
MLPLALDNLGFAVDGRPIIQGVSCEIGAGTRTLILGANGAGKSVLMRLCHGLLQPTSGSVRWWIDAGARRAPGTRAQAMVFQRPVLLRRSALANVVYALKLAGLPAPECERRAREMLAAVDMAPLASRPARVLSGGEQQRLALARAWALRPQVLFLDEPTASLDPNATRNIESIIDAIHAGGTKIIMTTHSLGQARRLGDEILLMSEGRLAERAPVDQFFNAPQSVEARAFLQGELP